MRVKGLLTTCDICGATTFNKLTGKSDFDCGYSRKDDFEPYEQDWIVEQIASKWVDLCPKCKEAWLAIGNAYLNSQKGDNNGTQNNSA